MDRLKQAAQVGDINEMYNCIREEEDALGWIDEAELVDTPLHIAANRGHVDFAMAMVHLKPSCGHKLNQEVYSPMHLAVRNGHAEVVFGLLAIDKDLVRVKGREGFTALHYAAEAGDLNLLAQFLKDCPACIEDVTIRNETALHVAAKKGKLEALQILARFLHRTDLYCRVSKRHLLDSKDRDGDTTLHIAAANTQPQMIKLLLECKVNTKEINSGGLTALDLLEMQSRDTPNREICLTMIHNGKTNLLMETAHNAGNFIRHLIFSNHRVPISFHEKLRSKVTFYEEFVIKLTQVIEHMSADKINALLVVLALILTATYQAMLSPPGGVWQGDYSANASSAETHVGQSVMESYKFINFYILNLYVFGLTSLLTVGFLQVASGSHVVAILFEVLLSFLIMCILVSERVIIPTKTPKVDGHHKSRPSIYQFQTYMPLIIILFLFMELCRRVFLHVLNPPALRLYKKFFRQM